MYPNENDHLEWQQPWQGAHTPEVEQYRPYYGRPFFRRRRFHPPIIIPIVLPPYYPVYQPYPYYGGPYYPY